MEHILSKYNKINFGYFYTFQRCKNYLLLSFFSQFKKNFIEVLFKVQRECTADQNSSKFNLKTGLC